MAGSAVIDEVAVFSDQALFGIGRQVSLDLFRMQMVIREGGVNLGEG